jgi:plasmid stabilization system protein ParE
MEYAVQVEDGVREDVLEIARWIARDSPGDAARWMERVWKSIRSLCLFPERCPIARDLGPLGFEIRHLVVGDYRIFFTIHPDRVLVLHVRHAARGTEGGG